MDDLIRLKDRFFAALNDNQLPECQALLQAARQHFTTNPANLWLDYLEAIVLVEQSPPAWDRADQTLATILAAHPPDDLCARTYLERARIADYQGEYGRAIEQNHHSLALFEALDDQIYVAKVLINLGIAHTHAFEYGQADQTALVEALACHTRALALCHTQGEEQRAAKVEMEIGTVYKAQGRWQAALEMYTARADKCRRYGWQRSLALTLNNSGEIYQHLQQYDQAALCYQEALQILHHLPSADAYEEADIQANLSLACQSLGQVEQALAASNRAIALIEEIRSPLASQPVRTSFFGTRIRIYDERIYFDLDRGQPTAALTTLERAKSRTFIELLAGRTALPLAGDRPASGEQTSLHQVNPLTADQIQQRLPADTLLLEYFITTERACVFVVTRDQLTVTPLADDLYALLKRQFEWKHQLPVRLTPDRSGHLRQPWSLPILYRLLLAPIADQLKQHPRLCIVPHGPLHYIPFHALIGSPSGLPRYFLEEATREIIYAPSATVLLDYCRTKPASQGHGGLVFSYGQSLPFVQNEGKAVAAILDGQLRTEAKATRAALQLESGSYPILHFACHGVFDPETPLASGLDLFDGRLRADYIVEHLRLRADLVTLSGCETGRSQVYRGDELIGLTRAFIFAGTPSVLVSLWQADDFATRVLMERFYQELVHGLPPATALRKAQCYVLHMPATRVWELLCDDGLSPDKATAEINRLLAVGGFSLAQGIGQQPVFSHPYYWAPFFLVGDRLQASRG